MIQNDSSNGIYNGKHMQFKRKAHLKEITRDLKAELDLRKMEEFTCYKG